MRSQVRKQLMSNGKPKRPSRPTKSRRPANPKGKTAGKRSVVGKRVRRRPKAKAAARQAKTAARPMPKPPARRPRPQAQARKTVEAASPELQAEVDGLQSQFAQLEADAQLSTVYSAIGDFDNQLVALPLKLDGLRERGYVHSDQIEEALEALDARWDEVRPRVESTLREHVARLDKELDRSEKQVDGLQAKASSIKAVEMVVNGLEKRIQVAESAVNGLYEGLEMELSGISYQLDQIEAMIKLLDESSEIELYEAEGPLLAVKAEWQQDGKEGPEGVLFLTDQRLLFEQREEVVTKKRLGLFKAESEMIERLLLDIQIDEVEGIDDKEEGGFLGMGKDDILEFVFAATADVSRARFHLKGQDSSDWAAMLKRVKSGEIDADRAEAYLDELEEAVETAAAFPATCFNCFAEVPPPPRGVASVSCEFCGATITPEVAGE